MADSTAKNILGVLIMAPALIRSTDELCTDLFSGRDKAIFNAINRIWTDTEPETIPLSMLVDRLDGKVSATYVSSLLDGVASVKPEEFKALVGELARQRLAKAIVKTVSDAEAEIVKTGEIDIATLLPLVKRYDAIGQKDKVMSSNIREWVYQSSGEFSVSKVYADLGAKSVQEKGLVRAVIHALFKDKIITRVGVEEGRYRKVEKELDEVDLMGVVPTPLDLYLPLGLDKLVKIYPKSIIVFVGDTNIGKTALLHDFIKYNMDNHEIHLLFREGGQELLVERLRMHTDRIIGQWHFKAYPRTQNFEDAIATRPNGIWGVDYLSPPDNPWEIKNVMDNIYGQIGDGLVYINMQKRSYSEVGCGGEGAMERAALYVSISKDSDYDHDRGNIQACIAKVLKAKVPAKGRSNPEGKIAKFQIEEGWKIHHDNYWSYPPKKTSSNRVDEFHPRKT